MFIYIFIIYLIPENHFLILFNFKCPKTSDFVYVNFPFSFAQIFLSMVADICWFLESSYLCLADMAWKDNPWAPVIG